MYATLAELKWHGSRALSELVGVVGAFRYTVWVLQKLQLCLALYWL